MVVDLGLVLAARLQVQRVACKVRVVLQTAGQNGVVPARRQRPAGGPAHQADSEEYRGCQAERLCLRARRDEERDADRERSGELQHVVAEYAAAEQRPGGRIQEPEVWERL